VARDIASVADKDIREDVEGPDDVPPSERPRSEGGPATREPEPRPPNETTQPPVAEAESETSASVGIPEPIADPAVAAEAPPQNAPCDPDNGAVPAVAEEILNAAAPVSQSSLAETAQLPAEAASEPPGSVDVPDPIADPVAAAEVPAQSVPLDPDDGAVPAVAEEIPHTAAPASDQTVPPLEVEAPAEACAPTPRVPAPESSAEIVAAEEVPSIAAEVPQDAARDEGSDDAEPWRTAIAGALTALPSEPAAPPVEPPQDRAAADVAEDRAAEATPAAASDHAHPSDAAEASFTSAAKDLFRPPAIEEEPHLITLGRRLNPTLSIPRPVAPDITPRADPVVAQEPWWKTTPWPVHLRTAARIGAYAVGGYLLLVLVLVAVFRFVNPPGSMLMLTQFLSGTAIDRRWVPLESISRNLVRAVIVSEDGRFCEHSGIDTAAIKEAIERASRGTPRGASTISMQVTKNLFLWNAKSYVRKVIEIPLTLYMELLWPKARILEVYLNIAEWGPGVFGAEAAAQRHFGKSAARLGEREAALLAAVLPNPVVRDAGSPSAQTSAKARVVQARVKAYGSVASCVASAAAATTPAAQTPAVRPPRTIRKTPSKPAARKKQPAPANDWAPVLNFGSP